MKVVSSAEMRDLEQRAAAGGHSYQAMMDRAGLATAQAIVQRLAGRAVLRVLVLVGPGNNGGDGLVAARHLAAWGHQVNVLIWRRATDGDPLLAPLSALGVAVWREDDEAAGSAWREALERCDVLVDALLGTGLVGGLRGRLPDLLAAVTERLQVRRGLAGTPTEPHSPTAPLAPQTGDRVPLVVAVDVPSGLDSDSGAIDPRALQADLTVTFAHPKRGHYAFPGADWVGELLVADIGIEPTLAEEVTTDLATAELVSGLLPPRPRDGHKGTFGKALVVAGSINYVGAPCLAATAAYRSGAGIVTLGVPEAIHSMVSSKLTEATYLVLPHSLGALAPGAAPLLRRHLADYDALLVGPGLGQASETDAFLQALLGGGASPRPLGFAAHAPAPQTTAGLPPLVLDADALNLLAGHTQWWRALPAQAVLTPHPGEMARLLGCSIAEVNADRLEAASRAAAQWGCTVLLKGAYSVVAAPDGRRTLIPFANAALATGGTGDVLAGLIVGLMAQGCAGYRAAVAGAYLHALAADYWRKEYGERGMLASDLLPLLPRALASLCR
jgi:NAD(P)H-hydrate epimerase